MILYVLQKATSSKCGHCDKYVYLLIEKDVNPVVLPIFFICFDCKKVFQAGIGELELEMEDEDVISPD